MAETHGIAPAPVTPQMFGNAGREHMDKYGKINTDLKSAIIKNIINGHLNRLLALVSLSTIHSCVL